MPFEERVAAALAGVSPQISLFRFEVYRALERARKVLASDAGQSSDKSALGEFAKGRIDPARFAMVSDQPDPLDGLGRALARRAVAWLETLATSGDEQFVVDVVSGSSAAEAIASRLEILGNAFGAAALVDLVHRRRHDPLHHSKLPDTNPFASWSAAQKRLAPPLIVKLNGEDLDASALTPFLDGSVRLVLVVNGAAPPAALARLISPGVFVAQAKDTQVLGSAVEFEGPCVIALIQASEALFTHDPRRGVAAWQRLNVTFMPDSIPRKSLGIWSAWQQREELAQLKALAVQPAFPTNSGDALIAAVGGAAVDPAERLTAWLLEQSDLRALITDV